MEITMAAVAEAVQKNWPHARVGTPDDSVVFGISGDHGASLLHILPTQTNEAPERLGLQLWADFFHANGEETNWHNQGWHKALEHCHYLNEALDWCTMRVQIDPTNPHTIRPLINRAVPVFLQDIVYAYAHDPGSSLLLGIIDLVREWNLVCPIVQAVSTGTRHDCAHLDQLLQTPAAQRC
jgi:hypothetical protein